MIYALMDEFFNIIKQYIDNRYSCVGFQRVDDEHRIYVRIDINNISDTRNIPIHIIIHITICIKAYGDLNVGDINIVSGKVNCTKYNLHNPDSIQLVLNEIHAIIGNHNEII